MDMKSKQGLHLLALIGAMVFLAIPVKATVTGLGNTNLIEGPASGTDSVVLAISPTNASWTATANASWLHLTTAYQGGTGSTNIIFSFDTNSGATRTGTLTIASQTLAVTQAGSTYVPAGELTSLFTLPGDDAEGICVDGAGTVYAVNSGFFTVMEWTPTNNTLSTIIQTSSFDPRFDGDG